MEALRAILGIKQLEPRPTRKKADALLNWGPGLFLVLFVVRLFLSLFVVFIVFHGFANENAQPVNERHRVEFGRRPDLSGPEDKVSNSSKGS